MLEPAKLVYTKTMTIENVRIRPTTALIIEAFTGLDWGQTQKCNASIKTQKKIKKRN